MPDRPVYINDYRLNCCLGNHSDQWFDKLSQQPDYRKTNAQQQYRYIDTDINIPHRIFRFLKQQIDELLGASTSTIEPARTQVFIGSTSYDIRDLEQRVEGAGDQEETNQRIYQQMKPLDLVANQLCDTFGFHRESYSFNTACTSSANALLYAARMITLGLLDDALVIGAEVFNYTSLRGFQSLGLLTQTQFNPFSRTRDGMQLGEGVSVIHLSNRAQNNSTIRLLGGAGSTDTFNVSTTNPDGSEIARTINLALADAGISSGMIKAIKAHGTATLNNDDAEANGLKRIFSNDIPPVFVYKPHIGHTLGGCGGNELVLFCESLKNGVFPCTSDRFEYDPELAITINPSVNHKINGPVLLNYFGFGGSNCSLVLSYDA